ncbi:MAG TPA: hypothetical protein V6C86_26660 [Oculatellaceae cyanobacterium]
MVDLPPVSRHEYKPDASFDGGNLDCGNGLLLLIRKHIDPLEPGELLEFRSTEPSVEVDLPSWCRLTKNELVSWCKNNNERSYLICKGPFDASSSSPTVSSSNVAKTTVTKTDRPRRLPPDSTSSSAAQTVHPLSVMGIGSWPRPQWLIRSLHDWLRGKVGDEEFQATADDAVRLAIDAQLRAGVDVITDGEQRRDNYSSFVGRLLDNCELIPLSDLVSLVDEPDKFQKLLETAAIPADKVRHPVVTGKLSCSNGLAIHELKFAQTITDKPIKVSLPGPYLLTRTMWLECITDRAYSSREELSVDIMRILRAEIDSLLSQGASIIQLDEPVLTEILFSAPNATRTFMCGALSERGDASAELEFATHLINSVTEGFPIDRLGLHICRGNWSPDESVALTGSYDALLPLLEKVRVGILFLEFCTSRAGEMDVLAHLPAATRVGVGLVNQKNSTVETVDEIVARANEAIAIIGKERLLITPDCGFATFADSPVSTVETAVAKLTALAKASAILKQNGSTSTTPSGH